MSEGSGDDEASGPAARFVPGRRLAPFLAGGLPLALFDGGTGLGLGAALAVDAVLVAGAFFESRRLGREAPSATRELDARLSVGVENRVRVRLHNPSARSVVVRLRDDLPPGFVAEPDELEVHLPPHARRDVDYVVVPPRRGRATFGDLHLRIEGGARLGASVVRIPSAEEVRVYPNVLGPRRYELATRLGDPTRLGFRRVRRSGGGGELSHLREYVTGDPLRAVDWKATAKRQRPITRVYEQERSQTVIVAIDAGRMMATRLGSATKLDHALNAALLLTYVALRRGDLVGLIVFADTVSRFVPPGRGPAQYRRLLEALYEVEAEETFVDFRRLVTFINLRVPRRALLVLFSDLLDEAHAMPLAEHAPLLRRKHLPVCVTMHDAVAETLADAPVTGPAEAYRRVAAADLLRERGAVKAHLEKRGVSLVEAPPGELALAAVDRYLDIKARGAL